MSLTEIIIFLADTLEPGRAYAGADRLRELVLEDLYAGALQVLIELDEYVERNGYVKSEDTTEAIEWILGLRPE
jgi:HD superfamily phosphohydrolase YqeK